MLPPFPLNFVFVLCLLASAFTLITAILRWLWNITIPDIFQVRRITFWEAFRLLLIGALLSSGAFIRFNFHG